MLSWKNGRKEVGCWSSLICASTNHLNISKFPSSNFSPEALFFTVAKDLLKTNFLSCYTFMQVLMFSVEVEAFFFFLILGGFENSYNKQ